MPQTWNPETYSRDAAFVPQLGSGVLEWLAPQTGERILDLGCNCHRHRRFAENGRRRPRTRHCRRGGLRGVAALRRSLF
jgi:hypothetical protein